MNTGVLETMVRVLRAGEGLLDSSLGFAGEESAGASFLVGTARCGPRTTA